MSTCQEEAGTQIFLHAEYALNQLQGNIIINSPDTDVFIISLMVSKKKYYFKTRNKNKAIIICVTRSKKLLKDKYDAVDSVGPEFFTKALVSLHAFKGCDRVSALAGLGKLKALKITAIKL